METTLYAGNYYGVSEYEVTDNMRKYPGKTFFVVCDRIGVAHFRDFCPDSKSLLIVAPLSDLVRRLIERGDPPENLSKRLRTAYGPELDCSSDFPFIPIYNGNGNLDRAIRHVLEYSNGDK